QVYPVLHSFRSVSTMSFRVFCPKCDAAYDLPEVFNGKTVRCSECVHIWRATEPDGEHRPSGQSIQTQPGRPARARLRVDAGASPRVSGAEKPRAVWLIAGLASAGVCLVAGIVLWLALRSKPLEPSRNPIDKKDDKFAGNPGRKN